MVHELAVLNKYQHLAVIEQYLQQEFEELTNGDGGLAHEIASYQHEAVDACLPPHSEDVVEYAFACQWLFRQFVHQARIDYIVMAHDE